MRFLTAASASRWFLVIAAAVVAAGVLLAIGGTRASADPTVVTRGDREVPYYARLVEGDENWSAVVFYRPPSCVPSDFNLFFSKLSAVRFDIPRVFGCGPATTEGTTQFFRGTAPNIIQLRGKGAVPVWLIDTDQLIAATGDGVVTIPELESLTHLKGSASQFHEVLQLITQGQKFLSVKAHGKLDDGRNFMVSIVHDQYRDHPGGHPDNAVIKIR